MLDPAWKEILLAAIGTAGAIFGGQEIKRRVWGNGSMSAEIVAELKGYASKEELHEALAEHMTREAHDRECVLKLMPLIKQVEAMHQDVKQMPQTIVTLLRNGPTK